MTLGTQSNAHTFADGYPYDLNIRWGWGNPPHAQLLDYFTQFEDDYRQTLSSFLKYRQSFAQIQLHSDTQNLLPYWDNGFLPGLDIIALYGMLAESNPETYLEIGSGNSTKVAHYARTQEKLTTKVISIDPVPRAEIDQLCDQIIREPLEHTDLARFEALKAGDILFFDGSHRVLQNSDVTVFFMDILPRVKPGVIIHIHDIPLPYDYPSEWRDRLYSEQYMLGAILLNAPSAFKILLPNVHIAHNGTAAQALDPFWSENPSLNSVDRNGCSFWFTKQS